MGTSPVARTGTSVTRAAQSTVVAAFAVAALFAASLAGPLGTANADPCTNVEVVFARGTMEAPGVGATGQAFADALTARLPGRSLDVYGVNYPASLDFGRATDGIADASNRIQSIAASCPSTKIVLGGYSQGAAVAGYTTASSVPDGFVLPASISGPMPPAIASHVAAVVLFGTPDDWFLGLADHNAPPITIGRAYAGKTLQLCAAGDPVCFPGGTDRSAHSSYAVNGMAGQAADYVGRQLGVAAPVAPVLQSSAEVRDEQQAPAPVG